MDVQFIDITSYRGISADAEHFYAKIGYPSKDCQEYYITDMGGDITRGIWFTNGRSLRYYPSEKEARQLWQKDHGFDKDPITLKNKEDDILALQEDGTIRFPSILSIVKEAKKEFPNSIICFSYSGYRKEFVKIILKMDENKDPEAAEIFKILNIK